MISQRERGLYQVFSATVICAAVALFILVYLSQSLLREGWYSAPDAYLQCLIVLVLGLLLEAATRSETHRINSGQCSRRIAMSLASRQTIWLLAAFGLLFLVSRDARISRAMVIGFLLAVFPLFYFFHRCGRDWVHLLFRSGSLRWRMRTTIVGPEDWSHSIRDSLNHFGELLDISDLVVVDLDLPVERIIARLEPRQIDVLVMSHLLPPATVAELLGLGDRMGFRCWIPLELSRRFGRRFELQNLGGLSILSPPAIPLANTLNRMVKRVFDLVVSSLVVCFVLWPLMIVVALIHRLYSPGPLLFKQNRVGENSRIFQIYKFRTMHVQNDEEARQATKDDQRVFRGGRLLRRLSLDEIPQFLNVLRGEMSVVGPRPHMLQHEQEFEAFHELYGSRRYVKPGVTGLAQVRGYRGEIQNPRDIRGRARYDLIYVRRWCLSLDLRLTLLTILYMIRPHRRAY